VQSSAPTPTPFGDRMQIKITSRATSTNMDERFQKEEMAGKEKKTTCPDFNLFLFNTASLTHANYEQQLWPTNFTGCMFK
jgi:hypothetical protein